jgi:hypothetical protein
MRVDLKEYVEIELQRRRVASAKSLLIEAKKQAQSAKVRRKLAKLLARRAREAAKQASANLAEAEADLDRAEAIVCNGKNGREGKGKESTPKSSARSRPKPAPKRHRVKANRRQLADVVLPIAAGSPLAAGPFDETISAALP